jgi:lysyl-tRNA synthetase class 2
MGKAAFFHLLDSAGKIQVYVRKDELGEQAFEEFTDLDIGDIVSVQGYLFVTKSGEKTLHAEAVRLLTKSLIPLPEKWHGLKDVEERYRHRYVDLIANPDSRNIFRTRAQIIAAIRSFLNQRGFLEVETPILHYIPGGATAKPFETYYNALHCQMTLRIALELPLKKLVVGGLDRVYEIGRNFRNEGLSKKHNPEFTMLEFYQAYATYEDAIVLTEELLYELVTSIHGNEKLAYGDKIINFARPWRRISMLDSLFEIGGVARAQDSDSLSGLKKIAQAHSIKLEHDDDWGIVLEQLWGELVEPKLIDPVFITQHPLSISPLARKNDTDPKVTDRFELIICGMEIANAFSELNDAIDQRQRFEEQAQRETAEDGGAKEIDEDFVRALEYGMPPTAGEGIGIDRLVMLLTNSPTIRDVLLFPQLKPESKQENHTEESV